MSRRGLFCQWTHTYDISDADLRSVVATFASVFPEALFEQAVARMPQARAHSLVGAAHAALGPAERARQAFAAAIK